MTSFKNHQLDFKTQYGLGLNPQDDEIVVDFFCGGGGAGTGLEMGLGRAVTVAKNHSPAAISMHTVNHPYASTSLLMCLKVIRTPNVMAGPLIGSICHLTAPITARQPVKSFSPPPAGSYVLK